MFTLPKTLLFSLLALSTLFASSQSFAAKPMSDTARNERAVVMFYTKVFVERKDVGKAARHFLTEDYIQHNPYVATGRQGFIDGLGSYLPTIPNTRYEIKRVVTSGDMVILHVHTYDITSDAPGQAGVDMFRVDQNGKIVEHWDVWQDIPTWMAHDNGMF